MLQKLLAILSASAIVLGTMPAVAQSARSASNGTLKMVMIDQAQLSSNQRSAFQRFLQSANLPRTKVGNRCQYYGKPQVWCVLLDPSVAQQVYNQLRNQPAFGSATEIKEVRRLREATPKPTGI
jgi:hypothetical protein